MSKLIIWTAGLTFAFSFAAIILSIIHIRHHIYYNHEPNTKKYIVTILFLIVVYSITSWLTLYWIHISIYFHTVCNIYKALVIYSFYQLHVEKCLSLSIGILQYSFFQLLITMTTFIYPYMDNYVTLSTTISQICAIYCLILFYLQLNKLPHESMRPIPKFVCITVT